MKAGKFVSVIVIIAVIVLAFFVYQSMALSPAKVVKSMQEKLAEVNSCHYLANVSIDGKFKNVPASIKIAVDADADAFDKTNPKTSAVIQGAFKTEGVQISVSAEMKSFKDRMYLRLVEIPSALGDKAKLPLDLEKFKNKWIKIDVPRKDESGEKKMETAREELKKWARENELFSKIEKLKDEVIEGNKCFHYGVIVNKGAIIDLVERMAKLSGGDVKPEDMAQLKKEMDNLKDIKGEVWIGKKNRFLYKYEVATEFTPEKLKETLNVAVEAVMSKYNEKMNIEAPADVLDLQEILRGFMPKIPSVPKIPKPVTP